MNKNELIVTDTLLYKICNFFRKIFPKKNNKNNENTENNFIQMKQGKNNFIQNISYKNETIEFNRKKELAEKLMNGKLSIDDLSNTEVDEMTEYFTMYINEMNQKLDQIKNFIINLKNKK